MGAGSTLLRAGLKESLSAAKRFLGRTRIRVFKEQMPPPKSAGSVPVKANDRA